MCIICLFILLVLTKHPRPRREQTKDEEVEDALLKTLRGVQEKQQASTNPNHHFGLEVAERLQQLTPHQAALAKVKIQQIMLECEFPPESYPHSHHYGTEY